MMLGLKMKKVLALLVAIAMLVALCGCSDSSDKKVLYVYNWGDYIGEGVIELFEEETGIDVIYSMFETNEDMYTKIKSTNGGNYDVIFPLTMMFAMIFIRYLNLNDPETMMV